MLKQCESQPQFESNVSAKLQTVPIEDAGQAIEAGETIPARLRVRLIRQWDEDGQTGLWPTLTGEMKWFAGKKEGDGKGIHRSPCTGRVFSRAGGQD